MNKLTTVAVINKYLQIKSNDRSDKRILRSNIDEAEIDMLPLKTVEIDNLSCKIYNPFTSLKSKTLSEIQCLVRKCCKEKYLEKRGSLAISASCGSGKTLCGIYLIYHFQCKTLIITTRNAVKDQWYEVLKNLYPNIKIYINNGKDEPTNDYDVWILTPQYFNNKDRIIDECFVINPSLIIYDEIHTMLSSNTLNHEFEFANILKYPFIKCINKVWSELPYLFAISATFPKSSKTIEKIFGRVLFTEHNKITEIPINVWDYRDTFTLKLRGKLDSRYRPLHELNFIEYLFSNITFYKSETKLNVSMGKIGKININKNYKGIIMLSKIDYSVWTALFVQKKLNCNVLLIRASNEQSYYLPINSVKDFKFNKTITLEKFLESNIAIPLTDYRKFVNESEIIVSTISRMKEGFNVEQIVWGICTQFPYSELTRVQICGRIRRNSENKDLNKHERIMYVCSSKVPNDSFQYGKRKFATAKVTYDWNYENELFMKENIHYISNHLI